MRHMDLGKGSKMFRSAKIYIKNVTERIEKIFETCLRSWYSPMVKKYCPGLDTNRFLESSEVSKYQILIGSLNWIVTLSRFDVQHATSTLER